MTRILVNIVLAEGGVEQIRSNPELPKKEMEFVNQWKEEDILEHFFITASKNGAVLIFQNITGIKAKELIEALPYFPFMSKIDYLTLDKHF
ncbi:MAG TPA: hypothetical protein VK796_07745 [Cytophaga sp.]|jgi:hypothetical protein|nr:hypothetical protein [Cytophaga sp.]